MLIRLLSLALIVSALLARQTPAQLVLSGNENKIDLSSGSQQVVAGAPPDSLSLLDFSTFPPRVEHLPGVSNTVIGPPSNIAITPDGKLALVASSLKIDPNDATATVPDDRIHLLDLAVRPPRVIGEVSAGAQPSGISITPDGRYGLGLVRK